MPQLVYLGLRGNKVTDAGLRHLVKLENLTGLHLGETEITDAGLQYVQHLTMLKKLWLHNTQVSDKAVTYLANLKALEQLEIYETKISEEGARRLQVALPQCRIVYHAEFSFPAVPHRLVAQRSPSGLAIQRLR